MNPRAPQVILLDWDGTLADVYPITRNAMNATLAARGDMPRDEATCQATSGLPLETMFPDPKDLNYFITEHVRLSAETPPPPVDGANAFVAYLQTLRAKGIFVGIVSNKPHHMIQEEADRFGWQNMFDTIIGSDDVPKRKPNPEPLAVALKAHPQGETLDRKKILFIGDTNTDAEFASNCGISFIGVGDKISHDYHRGKKCNDLHQLLTRMKLLFGSRNDELSRGS